MVKSTRARCIKCSVSVCFLWGAFERLQVWFQQGTLKVAHLGSLQRILCVCVVNDEELVKSDEKEANGESSDGEKSFKNDEKEVEGEKSTRDA